MSDELVKWELPGAGITNLIPTVESLQVVSAPIPSTLANAGPEDFVPPVLMQLHGTSSAVGEGVEGATPGRFMLSPGGQFYDSPVRILLVYYTITHYKPEEDPVGTKQCLSSDRINGSQYGACASCQYQDWGTNKRGTAPACSLVRNLFLLLPNGLVAKLRCKKSTSATAKNLITDALVNRWELYQHPVLIKGSTERNPAEAGVYHKFTLSWQRDMPTPKSWYPSLQKIADQLRQQHESGALHESPDSISE